MATIIAATGAAGNWTTGGAWVGGVAPTAADDAQITVATTSITIDVGAVARSADFTGFTGTLTQGATGTLALGDATAGLTNIALKLQAGATYVPNAASTITFKSTSATQQTITSGGYTLPNIVINGVGSSYQLSDNLTIKGNFTYTAGTTFDTTTGSRVITLNGASVTFTGGGKTYFEVDLTGSGNATVTGTNTYTNFNRTGTASKTDQLVLGANQTVTGIFTLAGNSNVNRLFVRSDTLGTARTITNSGATMTWSNVNLQDITLGTSFNASAITGLSGDCQGNTNITFTSPTTQTATMSTNHNWSDAIWTTHVPLPQDTASMASVTGGVLTANMPQVGAVDWTGATGSPTWTMNFIDYIFCMGITLVSGLTWNGVSSTFSLEGRGSYNLSTSGINNINALRIFMIGGTLTQLDSFTSTGSITFRNGTWNANGFNVTAPSITSTFAGTRTFTMGSGTWTLNSTGVVWDMDATGSLTINGNTSTLLVNETTQGTSKTLNMGISKTYNNITVTGKNVIFTFTTSLTVNVFALNNLGDTTGVTFPASKTLTISGFTTTASSGNVAKIISSSAGTAATLSKSTGIVSVDWVSIKDSAATGGAAWYAGANSTDVSGNTGWIFTAPPSGTNSGFFLFI